MKRKLVAMLLATAMVASMAACGNDTAGEESKTTTTPTETQQVVEDDFVEPEKITLVINGNLGATVENGQEEFRQQWEEAVGVDFEIKQLDHSGYRDQVGTMLASEEYPDVMFMTAEMYAQYATTGILWDMTEAYENADFYSKITKPLVNEAMKIDGKLYGFSPRIGNGCVSYVKESWLEAVGMKAEDIKTYDDYIELLRAFKNGDPDGNGVNGDTYGTVAAGFLNLEAPYVQYLPEFWQDAFPQIYENESGEWIDGFQEEATKEALTRLRSAYEEGLINPASLTMGTKDARTNYWQADQTGSAGVFTYWAGLWAYNITSELEKGDLDSRITWLNPIEEVGQYYDRQAPVFVIFDDGDGDDRREQWIFDKFCETMVDGGEVQMLWSYGAEGVHWSTAAEDVTLNAGTEKETTTSYKEGEFHMLPYPSDPNKLWSKNVNDPLLSIVPFEGEYANYVADNEILDEVNAFFTANCKMAPNAPASDLYTSYSGDINDAKTAAVAKVVTEGMDVDEAIAEYVAAVGDIVEEVLVDLNSK